MQEPRNDHMGAEDPASDVTAREWAEADERRMREEGRRARVREEAAATLRDAKQRVARAYDRTSSTASRAYRGAREYAQEHPDVAAAVSFAAGMGVGMMVSARNGRAYYKRGLIPVVAIALAQAVLDVFDQAR
jgi:ElaB/YqjD/DUF883 family membrane-anchored ribosome-binding protein